jgi:hypothetical protein
MAVHDSKSWLKKWEVWTIIDYSPWHNDREERERDWNNRTIIEHAPPKSPHSEHSKDSSFQFDCCYPSGSKKDDVSISNESLTSRFSLLEKLPSQFNQLVNWQQWHQFVSKLSSHETDQPKSTSGFDSNKSVSLPSYTFDNVTSDWG